MTLIATSQSKAFVRHLARATLCVAVVALLWLPGTAGAAQPGVVLPNPGDQTTQAQIAASGAKHVRVFASWRMLESQRGQLTPYILSGYDALANRMKAAGIPLYFVVTQTPSWASGSHAPNAPPPADAYADFIRRLAVHFRGRVGAYEIWNEPDEAFSWDGEATPAAYAALLKPATRPSRAPTRPRRSASAGWSPTISASSRASTPSARRATSTSSGCTPTRPATSPTPGWRAATRPGASRAGPSPVTGRFAPPCSITATTSPSG